MQTAVKGPPLFMPYLWRLLFRPGYTILSACEDLRKSYGDVVRVKLPLVFDIYVVTDADVIGKILMGTEKTNRKAAFFQRLKILLGEGLLTADGSLWKTSRRLANPAFHTRMLDSLTEVIQDESSKMVKAWEKAASSPMKVDFTEEMTRLTLAIICRALFSLDITEKANEIRNAINQVQDLAHYIFAAPFMLPKWVPTRFNRRVRNLSKVLDREIYKIIEEHRRNPQDYNDLLSAYLAARDEETGEGMSDQQLRDEVITLLVAGHETTASTIACAFSAIASAPEVQAKLKEEYRAFPLQTSAQDYKNLTYTGMVAQEVMRLYPAIWSIGRDLNEELQIKNYQLPKNARMLLVQYSTHRHPRYWKDPARFDPERFSPENSKNRHPFAYFPFGGGARNCVGMALAKLEVQIVLSTVLKSFDVTPVGDGSFNLLPRITLVPDRAIQLRIQKSL